MSRNEISAARLAFAAIVDATHPALLTIDDGIARGDLDYLHARLSYHASVARTSQTQTAAKRAFVDAAAAALRSIELAGGSSSVAHYAPC